MGYACYERNGRDQGYGVPATCDHPGCKEKIDRGMSFACGGDPTGNCGLFFCSTHRIHDKEYIPEHEQAPGDWFVCERCAKEDGKPFSPSPDVPEWTLHKLTDPTWKAWRDENPEKTLTLKKELTTCLNDSG